MTYSNATSKTEEALGTAKKAGRQFQDAGRAAANEAKEDFSDAARHAGEEVRRYLTTAANKAEEVGQDIETNIRNKPVQSTLIALGVGFIVGLIARK